MQPPRELDMRPAEIVQMSWRESVVIEEGAEFLEMEYLEADNV